MGFPSDLANSQPVDSQSGFGHTLRRSAVVSRLFPPQKKRLQRISSALSPAEAGKDTMRSAVETVNWQLPFTAFASDVGFGNPATNPFPPHGGGQASGGSSPMGRGELAGDGFGLI